jgi:hypothetical protein
LNVLDKRISVRGLPSQRLEDHHLERAGKEVTRLLLAIFHKACSEQA